MWERRLGCGGGGGGRYASRQLAYLVEEPLNVRIHQLLVQVIGDPATILDLGNQIPDGLPGRLIGFPGLHIYQMILSCRKRSERTSQTPKFLPPDSLLFQNNEKMMHTCCNAREYEMVMAL